MHKRLALVLAAGLVLAIAQPAVPSSGCEAADSGAELGVAVTAWASRGDECVEASHRVPGNATYPYRARFVVDAPLTFDGCPPGEMWAAIEYRDIRFLGDEGVVLYNDFECVPYGSVDPAVVVPPSDGAMWDAVREQLPLPAVRLSPAEKGLVGLETWFWADPGADGLTPVDHDGDPSTPARWGMTVTASVIGVTTSATVWIDEYRWRIDDDLVLTAPRPGSEPDPAATHTYSRKGPRQLMASTVWRGTWESPVGGGTLGPAELVGAPLDYHVYEVRAVPADR